MDWTRARTIAIGAGIDMAGKVGGVIVVLWLTAALIVGTAVLAVRLTEVVR